MRPSQAADVGGAQMKTSQVDGLRFEKKGGICSTQRTTQGWFKIGGIDQPFWWLRMSNENLATPKFDGLDSFWPFKIVERFRGASDTLRSHLNKGTASHFHRIGTKGLRGGFRISTWAGSPCILLAWGT